MHPIRHRVVFTPARRQAELELQNSVVRSEEEAAAVAVAVGLGLGEWQDFWQAGWGEVGR